jgi:hypothetical protein
MYFKPSIAAHTIHGVLAMLAIVFLLAFSYKLQTLDAYRILVLLLLFSIVIGIHGISHQGLERDYGYTPYSWFAALPLRPMECPCMAAMKRKAAEQQK